MNEQSKRLIEVSLPLQVISEQSAREKSIRHGHISTLHIWWARRPLAAMRAAIFAALVPAPDTDAERKELENLIATIVDWDQVKEGNSAKVLEARQRVLDAFDGRPPRLLDPFMGGGATGLEALRLGCDTHAVELNPVAHLIELCTLVYPQKYGQPEAVRPADADKPRQGRLPGQEEPEQITMDLPVAEATRNPLAEDVQKWGEWVLERAREEIGHLYENPEGDETIVGYLWARTITCPNPTCRAEIPLVRSWWLAKRKKRRQVALKPMIDREAKQVSFEVVDMLHDDVGSFDPSDGTSSRGHATCLVCSQVADVKYVRAEGVAGRMGEMPLGVITERDGLGKAYRRFTKQDAALFREATKRLSGLEGEPPDESIPLMSGTFNVPLYGLTRWRDLFNPRQLLVLLNLSSQVRAAYEEMIANNMDVGRAKAVATYLGILVDRQADFSTSLTRWVYQAEFVANTFSRQALPMIWDHPEVNPFSGSTGDWTGAMDWVLRVIDHTAQAADYPAQVQQGTATRLPYPDASLDTVITDPPYYNAVPYADLSDFFYVWLKQSVGFLYPDLFRTPLTPKSAEIVEMAGWDPRRYAHKDKAFYEQQMTAAFAEAERALCPNGVFVVVFAHKSLAAWETLLQSLLDAGLVVTASWPLHTERPGRLRAQGSAALASSIFIVCRVRQAETDGYLDDVREDLAETIRERLDFFWEQGIRGADFFISAIGPAVSVFGRYTAVYRLDGSPVGVDTLLDLVQEMVSEYALDRILNGGTARVGGVDAYTRYYILHRWAYGGERIPFDDAMRLSMALGADVTALIDRDLLKQYGDEVRLQGPKQRKDKKLGEVDRSGLAAPVIDVLHRAAVLWEQGDRDALAQFLARAASNREDQVRLVAQTIINILPESEDERRLLEGFLAGRDVLPDVARQERLI
jgi:adenine-specific DNA methylase